MPTAELGFLAALEHPFPGLRPFEPHESFLFFGREAHTRELLRRLSTHRMLAVVGSSGSGKSSLVRAGLLPALYSGHLAGAGTGWRIAVMRPGGAPLEELAVALISASPGTESTLAEVRELVGHTSLGLIEAAGRLTAGSSENLLLVVDQFEELFRFRREREHHGGEAEAALFVAELLEAVAQFDIPIYLVLTMRSDFLGDCAQFPDLPEALNRSQYLIPRLTRDQCREAIVGPLRVAGAEVAPRLAERILNEAGEDQDQLPILQHALAATFQIWKRDKQGPVDFDHYIEAGEVRDALNRHAERVYQGIPAEDGKRVAERVFRCLTTTENGRAVRRGARLSRICGVTGMTSASGREQVREIVRRFADPENSFLLLSTPDLDSDPVVDISHESLIRKWKTLTQWVRQEADSAEWYRLAVKGAKLNVAGEAGLWRDPQLRKVLKTRKRDGWNEAWASQYCPGYDEASRFLQQSINAQSRRRVALGVFAAAILVAAGLGYAKYRKDLNAAQLELWRQGSKSREVEAQVAEAKANVAMLQESLTKATGAAAQEKQRELNQQQAALDQLSKDANYQKNLVSVLQAKVGTEDPRIREAAQENERLQKELAAVKSQLATAQSEHQAGDERRLVDQLNAARYQITTLQAQLAASKSVQAAVPAPNIPASSKTSPPTTVFTCPAEQVFRIQKESIFPMKLNGADVYLYLTKVKLKEVDASFFMTGKPWWGDTGKLNGDTEIQSQGLKKADTVANGAFVDVQVAKGASVNVATAPGWRLSFHVIDYSNVNNHATIGLCGQGPP